MHEFLNAFNIIVCNAVIAPNCNYTYFNDAQGSKSMTDYFCVSSSLTNDLTTNVMRDELLNMSDHLPISIGINSVVVLSPGGDSVAPLPQGVKKGAKSRLRWDKAYLPLFYNRSNREAQHLMSPLDIFLTKIFGISDSLKIVDLPRSRAQIAAHRAEAKTLIEMVYNSLVAALNIAAKATVPSIGPARLKHWWNHELDCLKGAARVAFVKWRDGGNPRLGPLWDNYIMAKKVVKSTAKKIKKTNNEGVNNSLLESLNSTTKFWTMWRAKLGAPKNLPLLVNGKKSETDIAKEFSEYFYTVAAPNSAVRAAELQSEFRDRVADYGASEDLSACLLSVESVGKALKKLSNGSAPGVDNITAEHLKWAHPAITVMLTKLFNIMLLFEYVPDAFGMSIIIPLLH